MKEIKTREELDIFIDELKANRDKYLPNKVKFKGNIGYVIVGNGFLDIRDYPETSNTITADYYHPEHYIITKQHKKIYDFISVSNNSVEFSLKDDRTWIRVAVGNEDGKSRATSDMITYNKDVKKIYIYNNHGEVLYVVLSEESLEAAGFTKGKINSDYYFHKNEIAEVDNYMYYKKFDATYNKVDLKTLEKSLEWQNLSKEELKERINQAFKDNIKYGVDSLTYSVFEGLKYTFGIEIETCIGRLSDEDIENLNVKAVHDGSLRDAAGNTPGKLK